MKKEYFVYMITNTSGMLYTGVTNDLERRMLQHKSKSVSGFASRYNLAKLVYFESTTYAIEAISREMQIKSWLRKKKVALIETQNPGWKDLNEPNNDVILRERSDRSIRNHRGRILRCAQDDKEKRRIKEAETAR